MKSLILLIGILTGISGCQSGNVSDDSAKPDEQAQSESVPKGAEEKSAKPIPPSTTKSEDFLVVSFISKGGGVKQELIIGLEALISGFEQEHGAQLNFEIKPWGREGEVDYCFPRNSVSAELLDIFEKDVRGTLGNSELVFVEIKEVCPH